MLMCRCDATPAVHTALGCCTPCQALLQGRSPAVGLSRRACFPVCCVGRPFKPAAHEDARTHPAPSSCLCSRDNARFSAEDKERLTLEFSLGNGDTGARWARCARWACCGGWALHRHAAQSMSPCLQLHRNTLLPRPQLLLQTAPWGRARLPRLAACLPAFTIRTCPALQCCCRQRHGAGHARHVAAHHCVALHAHLPPHRAGKSFLSLVNVGL